MSLSARLAQSGNWSQFSTSPMTLGKYLHALIKHERDPRLFLSPALSPSDARPGRSAVTHISGVLPIAPTFLLPGLAATECCRRHQINCDPTERFVIRRLAAIVIGVGILCIVGAFLCSLPSSTPFQSFDPYRPKVQNCHANHSPPRPFLRLRAPFRSHYPAYVELLYAIASIAYNAAVSPLPLTLNAIICITWAQHFIMCPETPQLALEVQDRSEKSVSKSLLESITLRIEKSIIPRNHH
ncbi:hypothetical protein KC338_g314 [Hortaea werneckii]|nr:hypothetical protein KC338_g314 [Hortaea werneckii]